MRVRAISTITLSAVLSCGVASGPATAQPSGHEIMWGSYVATVNADRTPHPDMR